MYQRTKMVSIFLETFEIPLDLAVFASVSFICGILLFWRSEVREVLASGRK